MTNRSKRDNKNSEEPSRMASVQETGATSPGITRTQSEEQQFIIVEWEPLQMQPSYVYAVRGRNDCLGFLFVENGGGRIVGQPSLQLHTVGLYSNSLPPQIYVDEQVVLPLELSRQIALNRLRQVAVELSMGQTWNLKPADNPALAIVDYSRVLETKFSHGAMIDILDCVAAHSDELGFVSSDHEALRLLYEECAALWPETPEAKRAIR